MRYTFSDILKAHFEHEGWHAVYKKYGGAILARENYRWKRKIRKRFGECRKCMLRAELYKRNTLLDKIGRLQKTMADDHVLFVSQGNRIGKTTFGRAFYEPD